MSVDADGDARFLSYFFGLNVTVNETFGRTPAPAPAADDGDDASVTTTVAGADDSGGGDDDAQQPCAKRLILSSLPSYEIHFFEVHVIALVIVTRWVA